MDIPMDYHVWDAMLEHYQRHMPKLTNIMLSWMTVLSTTRNDLLHQFINKATVSFLQQISIAGYCNWWAMTLWTFCLNTEWAIGIWYSSLKHLSCWWKALHNLICYSWIFNVQLYVHLKKWTLKFKLLYLLNHISYFNKIWRICCLNTHIQNLKVWLKSVLPWLIYRIFFWGIVFYWRTLYSSWQLIVMLRKWRQRVKGQGHAVTTCAAGVEVQIDMTAEVSSHFLRFVIYLRPWADAWSDNDCRQVTLYLIHRQTGSHCSSVELLSCEKWSVHDILLRVKPITKSLRYSTC